MVMLTLTQVPKNKWHIYAISFSVKEHFYFNMLEMLTGICLSTLCQGQYTAYSIPIFLSSKKFDSTQFKI
jgi:hypothetical protein